MDTKRLKIRRFSPDDWPDLYEYLSQEEVVKYEPYDVFTVEQAKEEAFRRSKLPVFWAVCLRDTKKVIGNLSMSQQDFHTWEIGYVFHSAFHGKGYATEAASAIIETAFTNWGAWRIAAMCNPLNTASWKLLERLYMRREGHLIKNIYFSKDEHGCPIWQDTYEYAILKEEWFQSHKIDA